MLQSMGLQTVEDERATELHIIYIYIYMIYIYIYDIYIYDLIRLTV